MNRLALFARKVITPETVILDGVVLVEGTKILEVGNYKSVKFLSRSETQDFVSLTFEYEWELTYGNTNMNGKASGVSVYLKTNEGYISIFDAQTQ